MANIFGTTASETLSGSSGNDSIYGYAGNDRINTGDGVDYVEGGDGNDTINKYLENGSSTLLGGAGNDTVWGGNDNEIIDGGEGDDSWLEGFGGSDIISGGNGNDKLYGSDGDDTLDGGNGNDELYGGAGNDSLIGGDGNDYLSDTGGNNYYDAGSGNDTIFGDTGKDTILGGIGDDSIYGWDGDDSISGGDGTDTVYGGIGNDSLNGGNGNDELNGSDGDDTLDGGNGNDELYGGSGNDTYYVRSTTQYIQDSSGTDTAYVYASFVKVPSTIENVFYLDGALDLPYWIAALLPDSAAGLRFANLLQNTNVIYYNFPSIIPAHQAIDEVDKANWTPFTTAQQARAVTALNYVSSVIDINFFQSTDSSALNTITFANNLQTDSAAYAYLPNTSAYGSDVYLDSATLGNANISDGTYAAFTFIHELGHALGLKHPFYDPSAGTSNPPYLSETEDKTALTVMSYTDSSSEYYLKFSPLDIAALQYLYGPCTNSRTGNDTYSINSSSSNFLWDGTGLDTLSAADVNEGCTIYLTPGYWGFVGATKASLISSSGQVTVNFGTVIENLTGSQYSDNLYGNQEANTINGGAGNDVIEGWAGDDTLIGGLGDDRLDGGDGIDVAYFNGLRANYAVSWSSTSSSYIVRSNVEGTDTLAGIEMLRFTDLSVSASLFQDSVAPAIALSANKASLSVGETASLTLTLSEASTTFTASDVTVTGGTLSNFSGSDTTYTALFTPTTNSTTNGVVRVDSGVFTDAAGNANADGSDANNTVTFKVNTVAVTITQTNTLSIIVDKGILGSDAVMLKNLKEVKTTLDGRVLSHTVEYEGAMFDFAPIDPLITTVTRDGEFTQEFRDEIAQAYPGVENILYSDAVAIVGVANIDQILLGVAGFDGDFVN
jgi:Ca2+-binding RTX toxin-like protein